MQKNKKFSFVHSFIALPFMVATLPFGQGPVISNNPIAAIVQKQQEALSPEEAHAALVTEQAAKIDRYFEGKNLPMAGHGEKLVLEAEKNGIDPFLVAAIGMRESTGGLHKCKSVPNNYFGWHSCKKGFDSVDKAIETVSRNLGGNNPNTAYHYDNKSTRGILEAYNPPTIVARYADQVMGSMEDIENS